MGKIKLQTGNFAHFDNKDLELVSRYKWYEDHGYARTSSFGKKLYMHRLLMDAKSKHIDHINGNKLDNRKENLRLCTNAQNRINVNKYKNNKSGYKGVSFHSNLWRATIVRNGKQYSLGYHKSKEEAALAYNIKAKQLFGEFANLNEI